MTDVTDPTEEVTIELWNCTTLPDGVFERRRIQSKEIFTPSPGYGIIHRFNEDNPKEREAAFTIWRYMNEDTQETCYDLNRSIIKVTDAINSVRYHGRNNVAVWGPPLMSMCLASMLRSMGMRVYLPIFTGTSTDKVGANSLVGAYAILQVVHKGWREY